MSTAIEAAQPTFFGHPRGLVICFGTELWERFSYYGMRALLIFYLTQHFLFSDGQAFLIYGAYTALVYLKGPRQWRASPEIPSTCRLFIYHWRLLLPGLAF
ncbi:MAG: hypothetical protein ACI9WS_000835 [Paraglaciecola psychrophila]|jgi:hypothetical protein